MVLKIIPAIYDQLPSNPVEMLLISFGSQSDIADFCSVSQQAVHNWKSRGAIPKWYVKDLCSYTGIPEWMLCPKHFNKGESDVLDGNANEGTGQDR
jgi:hypothetical protein